MFKQIKQRFGVGQQFRNTPFSHNLFPCKRSRCAACTTTMRTRTNLTHATRAYDRVSSRHCVKATAAHHKPANVSSVNKNAAFVALRPPSNAQLCKALLPDDTLNLCGRCGGIAAKSSLSIAGNARWLHVQHRSLRLPHHHSAKQATHTSTLEALGFIDPPSA